MLFTALMFKKILVGNKIIATKMQLRSTNEKRGDDSKIWSADYTSPICSNQQQSIYRLFKKKASSLLM